ncbi:hypothetical protein QRO08_09950 [Paracidovorax citrulli]|uniref:Uncharacterized protein n=1 Tax=Paracidovorax citrulli TaxID=80869 RepID=A0ABY9AVF3_PARCI|nr:hypothetical protein [Paracidovorax citrulli]ATG93065.1 hypothetical protein CQB05_02570 [Paracidovorax citrulli]MVT29077.1 hypothetical protein [Paracidovorax citrulli]MVT36752.1 hypothetical protein [Paracidovorax citrulli]PVY67194.1 hypothetical protein C8E08_4629 [Paracidovorax citrulli]REG68643.1 hypothetical protein C8E07_1762 [Paracidovorax citrulli]
MIVEIFFLSALVLWAFAFSRAFVEKFEGRRSPITSMLFWTGLALLPLGVLVSTIAKVLS